MKPFTENVIQIIKQIPPGKVMTYGQIAKIAGSPRGARQVVRVLHSMSKKYNLPWFRVINSKGEIAIRDEETHDAQIIFLEDEGVEVVDGAVELSKYQYHPK
ncbi:MGMT family protein [Bacillus sp. REN16]|uniref:MGMT family protein n=1 Tax=Bacillus sp. REN16 TaxID=2887296 RepID=UPI001E4BF6F5|nr:MGMT family protein [Bacillus sp. REN16]MCC3355485.1 MGMT family protein [Bacillus sp. REN16]